MCAKLPKFLPVAENTTAPRPRQTPFPCPTRRRTKRTRTVTWIFASTGETLEERTGTVSNQRAPRASLHNSARGVDEPDGSTLTHTVGGRHHYSDGRMHADVEKRRSRYTTTTHIGGGVRIDGHYTPLLAP